MCAAVSERRPEGVEMAGRAHAVYARAPRQRSRLPRGEFTAHIPFLECQLVRKYSK